MWCCNLSNPSLSQRNAEPTLKLTLYNYFSMCSQTTCKYWTCEFFLFSILIHATLWSRPNQDLFSFSIENKVNYNF